MDHPPGIDWSAFPASTPSGSPPPPPTSLNLFVIQEEQEDNQTKINNQSSYRENAFWESPNNGNTGKLLRLLLFH